MKKTATYREAIRTLARLKDDYAFKDESHAYMLARYTVAMIYKATFDEVENDVAKTREK